MAFVNTGHLSRFNSNVAAWALHTDNAVYGEYRVCSWMDNCTVTVKHSYSVRGDIITTGHTHTVINILTGCAMAQAVTHIIDSLSPRRPRFNPRPLNMVLVVDKVALRHVFIQVL